MRLELPIVSFTCTVLVLIPLHWHWRTRHIPTLSYIFWLTVVNLTRGINTIIWAGNTKDCAPVWCDIVTKLQIGANWAYCSTAVAMSRHLAQVSSPRNQIEDAAAKRRRMIFETFMCVVLPLIAMPLHYVVQGNRYYIEEDFGCAPFIYPTIVSIFIVSAPPLLFAFITLVYSGISLCWFVQRNAEFEDVLQSDNSGLTKGRYLRLIALLTTTALMTTTMTTYVLISNVKAGGAKPWPSWKTVHEDWYHISEYPRDSIPESFRARRLLTWYLMPITSVNFFAFFGFGAEAMEEYAGYFNFIKAGIFRAKSSPQPTLPISRVAQDSTD